MEHFSALTYAAVIVTPKACVKHGQSRGASEYYLNIQTNYTNWLSMIPEHYHSGPTPSPKGSARLWYRSVGMLNSLFH